MLRARTARTANQGKNNGKLEETWERKLTLGISTKVLLDMKKTGDSTHRVLTRAKRCFL